LRVIALKHKSTTLLRSIFNENPDHPRFILKSLKTSLFEETRQAVSFSMALAGWASLS